jgi:5-methylcytosine-specific restriction endonuclease McrA
VQERRVCRNCGKSKPIERFEVDKRVPTGRTNRCKACKFKAESKATRAYRRLYGRQKKYPIPVEVTRKDVEAIFTIFGGRCAYCSCVETKETGTFNLEHVIPLIRDGRHHVSNLVISCKSCNSRKGDKPVSEFYRTYDKFQLPNYLFLLEYIGYFTGKTPDQVEEEILGPDYYKWQKKVKIS